MEQSRCYRKSRAFSRWVGKNLDKLLEQFVDVEYGMISYITILNDLEELYDQKDKEDLRKLTIATITQLTSLQENLSRVISLQYP